MKLYHGSNVSFDVIDLSKSHPFKDFGKGFYVTTIEEQAIAMAKRTTDIEKTGIPAVMTYEFDELDLQDLSYKKFPAGNDELSDKWAEFILNNRNRKFTDFADQLSNHDNKYDIVFGPVANDNIARVFSLYTQGIIRYEQLKDELKFKKLTDQFSFHTDKAVALLKLVEVR
ncbi:hypothetical protein FACS1894125_1630 [Actinomycetota bacterium]|nr:hypothetical protein FACS1894125_1630 [Actinomycetota bacterium]